ncbi:hypothetical protein D3P07_01935 [Paenibacillus sp. 1011MAR3C5]|uniref:hypothetical protein n=1 Tax=Paenibacillus sp. 1011MAR3C5 TaxID=1675787 RepID=UPI000E6D14D6|nr:hypothetical protein [Paenibacillus sp. 1011MAR3C5]RJE90874.1 hypothetical protein D3P07_01935 [Paenibacillus sp. 1011MAR3C5]
MHIMFKSKLILLALLATLVLGACAGEEKTVQPTSSPLPVVEQPQTAPEVEPTTALSERNLVLSPAVQQDGTLLVKLDGMGDSFSFYVKSSVELQSRIYQYLHVFHDDHNLTDALVSVDPAAGTAEIRLVQTIPGSNLPGYNFFISNSGILGKLGDNRVLLLEPEVTDDGVKVHLSILHTETGELERLHSDIWPEMDPYDKIYQKRWDEEKGMLFLQSFEGTIWLFDLKSGTDQRLDESFRVIPHSTTGYPSLFVSPAMDRFAFDDESGAVTFYDMSGKAQGAYLLPEDHYVPSDKVKWNAAGSIAWVESADAADRWVKAIDMDFLIIAPQQIDFLDKNAKPIRSLQASKGRSIEVAGWENESTAVIREYEYRADDEVRESNVFYYTYEVKTGKKSATAAESPLDPVSPIRNQYDYEVHEHSLQFRLKAKAD